MWPRRLPSKTAAAEWSTEGRIRRTLACRRRRGVERSVNAGDHNVTFFKTVEDLGRRHAGYGVSDWHYDTVGAALIWTLEKGLGSAFTPEVKEAWTTVYGVLACTMKNAAAKELSAA